MIQLVLKKINYTTSIFTKCLFIIMLLFLSKSLFAQSRSQFLQPVDYNKDQLVKMAVQGFIAPPRIGDSPYRIDTNGKLHVVPGTGSITYNFKTGDSAINIADGVKLLTKNNNVGLVRYDGIAGHTGTALKLCEHKNGKDKFTYCAIDHKRSQRPITYSNQPHLRHKRFTEYYGLYPENVSLGRCERLYANHVKRNPDGPQIAILEDGIQNRFTHLGAGNNSRQHSEWDK